jgi:hypothetical protein
MSTTDDAALLISIALRDGATLSVGRDAIHVGDERIELARLQDVRQIVPEPETFAVRVAGRRLVEFQPDRPGDGGRVLEAIFRLRPDLRPAGFEPPANIPDWWPSASLAPPSPPPSAWDAPASGSVPAIDTGAGAPPLPNSPYGFGPTYPGGSDSPRPIFTRAGYPRIAVASPDGRLTPAPRETWGLIGAPFRLFAAQWRAWLALGVFAAGLPAVLSGAVWMAFYAAQGYNPWRGLDASALGLWPTHPPHGGRLALLVALAITLFAVAMLAGAWTIAVLSAAGRDALLGRPIDVRASLESGVRRFRDVLLVSLVVYGGPLVAVALPLALAAAVAPVLDSPNAATSSDPTILLAATLGCLGLILFVAAGIAGIYALLRLFIAPYIAATQPLDVRGAILESWRLTATPSRPGVPARRWRTPGWRTVIPVVVVALIVAVASAPVDRVELVSYALAMLLVSPLVACISAPLTSLAVVAVLYDLRLRAEGYDALVHKSST